MMERMWSLEVMVLTKLLELNEIETPRMDVENETESPWSIHSPEAKRLKKIRERKRLGEFNEKMDQYLEERGLMLDLDRVKLNGIKPRRLASHEEIESRERPIEVRDLPMMPSHASLSSKKPLYRLEVRRVPSDGCGLKMNEVEEESFLRIREVFAQNIHPIQNIDAPPSIRGEKALISSKIGTLSHKKEGTERESARAFLISENQISNLVQNSNTEDLVYTRQAHRDTDVVLDTSRDPPDLGKHVRSGADSLAESVKSASDWTQAGVDLKSVSYQGQPERELSMAAGGTMILDSNPEGMMLPCTSRSLSSMRRRRKTMKIRRRVSRRILMSWQTRRSA